MEKLTLLAWLFDGLLVFSLLSLAWLSLTSSNLYRAIVLFIAFGLLMALAWIRLNAPDLALAEAAIGAGLSGALLLTALARLSPQDTHSSEPPPQPGFFGLLTGMTLLLMTLGLGYSVMTISPGNEGLSAAVTENLGNSGVGHPVTAVLLNFRGYDTMLEMVVLLLALLAVWSLGGLPAHNQTEAGPILETLARLLVPIYILVAAYLLWVGADSSGGAFQAGSVLAAAGVLLLLVNWTLPERLAGFPLRLALITGTSAFVIIAALPLFYGRALMEFIPTQAGSLLLIIETAAMISIAVILTALFQATPPEYED